jgi:GNAT superfamily N-acetyltransferase
VEGARLAVRADADRCAELCQQALAELQQQRGGSLYARRETGVVAKALLRPGGLDGLLASSRRRVLVGTIDDMVVGMAVGHLDDVGEALLGVVDGCYVEQEGRGVGVGRALLDGLVSWFSSSSCRGVDAAALPGDRRTKNFFEAAGFKARLLTLHHPLG